MADESELRRMLEQEASGAPTPELDAGRLVRRSRARRLPRQVAAGGVLTLAVVGLGVGTATGVRLLDPPAEVTSAGGGAERADEQAGALSEGDPEPESGGESWDSAAGGAIQLAPAYKINACGGMLALPPDEGMRGIGVEVEFPDAADASGAVRGTVEITNDTGERLRGVMSDMAATTLSRNGEVLWHTPRLERTLPVDLEPGESRTIEASFEPRVCSAEHEALEDFPAGLPPVEPGTYEVSVALDVEQPDGLVLQMISEPEPIILR